MAATFALGILGITFLLNGAAWYGVVCLAATLILALATIYGPSETLIVAAKVLRVFSW